MLWPSLGGVVVKCALAFYWLGSSEICCPSSDSVAVKYALAFSGGLVVKSVLAFFRQGGGEICSSLLLAR